jgi:acetyltransferase-like isoleucine patch superfamily enzyme
MYKLLASLAIAALPWRIKRPLLSLLFGYQLPKSSRIGLSLVMADTVMLGCDARIGHFNVIAGLQKLELGDFAIINRFNWISGLSLAETKFFAGFARVPSLKLGAHAAVTNRHLIDCTDSVEVGSFATIAGSRSQILTHSIDIFTCKQTCAPVKVGNYSFIGSSCVLLKGAELPAKSVLAAGAVLSRTPDEGEYWLYAGVPARGIKPLSPSAQYFSRSVGEVI